MRTYTSGTATLAIILGSIIGLVALAVGTLAAEAKPGYFRHPDIHGNRVVFTAEGDLWIATLDGLQVRDVRRISSHPGDEMAARFSPDGEWIAFTGYYDGNSDIYIVSASGGEPRRLTWHPSSDRAIGWTPDGKRLIFSSMRCNPHWNRELFALPVEGGEPEKLPLGRANYIDMDAASGLWAFTRTWGGGTWKRYRGGTAPNIWVGHPERGDFTEVTDFDGPEVLPMWHSGRIYFLCDQGGTANIWSILPDGSGRTQYTHFKVWDARGAAMGPSGRIVFTLAGDLHIFDPSDGSEGTLSIDLPSERNLTRKRYPNPSQYLTGYALAPEGDRVAVAARGEIFSIPVEDGVTLPVTRGSGARESRVSYGPKGKRVVYITDESGEEAIVTADAWGRGDVKEVKGPGKAGWHFPPVCSPDGAWIAYADMTHTLYVVKADGGKSHEVDRCTETEIRNYAWSPDGRWLAYAMNNSVEFSSIYIYDTKERTSHQITGWETDDFNPTWDPKGRYLYFLSARSINPMLGWFDYETIVINPMKPYLVLLRSDVENPLAHTKGMPPKDDEDADKKDKDKKDKDKDAGDKHDGDTDKDDKSDEDDEAIEPVEIEFEGLADRIVQLPVDAGKYRGVAATEGKLFYLSFPLTGLNEEEGPEDRPAPKGTLMAFDLEEKEASTFMDGVAGFDLQAKAEKILVSKGQGQLFVVDAGSPPGDDLSDAAVSLDGIVVELDPHEEWRQIYFEGWRNMRDFYWDESMHGVDWKAVRDQYATLLPRLATRQDLTDLMKEMVGELVTSHTYVWGGDPGRVVPRHSTGLLGAVMVREKDAFRVGRIYRGGVADGVRSPLQEPGVNVKEGDYILEINLQPFPPDKPFEASLENMAGKEVLLTVNDRPEVKGARHVVVKPLPSEWRLLYADWVRGNREYIAEKTDGKIGYIHIPDMSGRGMVAFDTWFYPQLDKEGMIVDIRWNRGGFVSQIILSRFQRSILSWDRQRWGGVDTYPYRTLNGPFVVLTNEHAGSDGDIFPEAIQLAGLAPVIGKRSWGGVNGIRGGKPFVDGGLLTHPEFAWWDLKRGWGLEGRGVEPDIEVTNLPQELAKGIDAQMDRAIGEVMKLHREHPPLKPSFGPAPDKSRKAYHHER